MSEFITLDFETANSDLSSICQIGLVHFKNGEIIKKWGSLIDPEDDFDFMNISIHGITENDIENSPKFPDIFEILKDYIEDKIVVSHGWFDSCCMRQVQEKYNLNSINATWLDATKIVRRSLTQFSHKGYGLQNIASHFSISTVAHDALNDAETCGKILLKIFSDTKTDINDWLVLIKNPLFAFVEGYSDVLITNQHGEYFGQSIAFTGQLSIIRRDAQKLASELGFEIHDGIKKTTDFLVVGQQISVQLSDGEKSSKQLKAENLIKQGLKVRLISEPDFLRLCGFNK
jgi:DNA polymerase-3 subunit epsilon